MNLIELKQLFDEWGCEGNKIVIKKDIAYVLSFIKKNFHYDILKSITAIDWKDNGIELIYNLYSTENEENIIFSIIVKDTVESVSTIYDSAIADEKEIYDLFGVNFIGNKELTRLYMPEGWNGHPLKKDYQENDERLNWNE